MYRRRGCRKASADGFGTNHTNESRIVDNLRVLLAVEPPILSELLADWFHNAPGVQIVGFAQHPMEALLAVRRTEADVVVTVTETDEVPCVCSHLFSEFPALLVVAISADAKEARLYRQQVCQTPVTMNASQDLLASMRLLLAEGNDSIPYHRVTRPLAGTKSSTIARKNSTSPDLIQAVECEFR
jgi:DNA-binding NarL/FixJ family response regulator